MAYDTPIITWTFEYTGDYQRFVVPFDGLYKITINSGAGGYVTGLNGNYFKINKFKRYSINPFDHTISDNIQISGLDNMYNISNAKRKQTTIRRVLNTGAALCVIVGNDSTPVMITDGTPDALSNKTPAGVNVSTYFMKTNGCVTKYGPALSSSDSRFHIKSSKSNGRDVVDIYASYGCASGLYVTGSNTGFNIPLSVLINTKQNSEGRWDYGREPDVLGWAIGGPGLNLQINGDGNHDSSPWYSVNEYMMSTSSLYYEQMSIIPRSYEHRRGSGITYNGIRYDDSLENDISVSGTKPMVKIELMDLLSPFIIGKKPVIGAYKGTQKIL